MERTQSRGTPTHHFLGNCWQTPLNQAIKGRVLSGLALVGTQPHTKHSHRHTDMTTREPRKVVTGCILHGKTTKDRQQGTLNRPEWLSPF